MQTDVNTTCEGEYHLDHDDDDDNDMDAYELLSEAMSGSNSAKPRPRPKPRITPTSSSSSLPSTDSGNLTAHPYSGQWKSTGFTGQELYHCSL